MSSIAHQVFRCLSTITLNKEQIDEMKTRLGTASLKKALRPNGNPMKPLPYIIGKGTYKTYFRTARTFFHYVREDTGEKEIRQMLNYKTIMNTFNIHYSNGSAWTAYKIQAAIKKVFAGASQLGWVHGACPIDNELHELIGIHMRTPRYGYHPEDANRILAHLGDKKSVHTLAVKIIFRGALREDETASLSGMSVDRVRRMLCIKGKGGKYREIPVPSSLLEILPTTRGYFFTPKESWCRNLRKGVQKVCIELGIEESGIHRFRATRAQIWYAAFRNHGLNDREARIKVSKLLGHNRIDVTFSYIPKDFDWESFIPYLDLEDEDLYS